MGSDQPANYVLITGVSSGIGYATARELVHRGFYVLGSVRSSERARSLQDDLGARFTPLLFDVTDPESLKAATKKAWEITGGRGLAGLVNNSGVSMPGTLKDMPVERIQDQFDVNVLGLIRVTQSFLPLLHAVPNSPFPPGRIINVSSAMARFALPFNGPYAATKGAIEALSDSLRRELVIYGIGVVIIQPCAVWTPMVDKGIRALQDLQRSDYGPAWSKIQRTTDLIIGRAVSAERVAVVIRKALSARRPRIRYRVVRSWWIDSFFPQLLPTRAVDRILIWLGGLNYRV